MKNKYTAEDMLHDLNEMKEFWSYLSGKTGNIERKNYDRGVADACVIAINMFKTYLADNAKGANNAV